MLRGRYYTCDKCEKSMLMKDVLPDQHFCEHCAPTIYSEKKDLNSYVFDTTDYVKLTSYPNKGDL